MKTLSRRGRWRHSRPELAHAQCEWRSVVMVLYIHKSRCFADIKKIKIKSRVKTVGTVEVKYKRRQQRNRRHDLQLPSSLLHHIPQCRAALTSPSSLRCLRPAEEFQVKQQSVVLGTLGVSCAVNPTHLHLPAGAEQRGAFDLLTSADLTGGVGWSTQREGKLTPEGLDGNQTDGFQKLLNEQKAVHGAFYLRVIQRTSE